MSQPAGSCPEPGEMLGPYRIVRRLGFGGMGVVFEALDGTLNRPVALKVISSHLAGDDGFRQRFVREARAQASVRSPHVVAVHSHGEVDGRLYIATELVDAGDLGRLLRTSGPLGLPTAVDVVAQVASGLADAHTAGLVHRDLTPANVLLRRRGTGWDAYLADFGIARPAGAASGGPSAGPDPGDTDGTPAFQAPELAAGGRAGVASDVYSLGCVLWTAVSGSPPPVGQVPQLPPGSPPVAAVNLTLRRCLATDPADRYRDAAEAARDLRTTTIPVPTRRRRRRPVVVAVAVGAGIAVGIGAALWPSTPDQAPSTGDEERAAASLTQALVDQGMVTEDVGACVAEGWIDGVGLDAMVEAGFFDEDLDYVDQPQESITPEMQRVLTGVVAECSLSR